MDIETELGRTLILCGYVLEQRALDLKESKQPRKISDFCNLHGFNLVFTEKEVGLPRMLSRPGLWRVTRALICYSCDPGDMPLSFDIEAWVQRALMPCRCVQPTGVDGIVLSSIRSLCTDSVGGSRYALAMAVIRKHLFVAEEGKCMSCCNPAAEPFMSRYV